MEQLRGGTTLVELVQLFNSVQYSHTTLFLTPADGEKSIDCNECSARPPIGPLQYWATEYFLEE